MSDFEPSNLEMGWESQRQQNPHSPSAESEDVSFQIDQWMQFNEDASQLQDSVPETAATLQSPDGSVSAPHTTSATGPRHPIDPQLLGPLELQEGTSPRDGNDILTEIDRQRRAESTSSDGGRGDQEAQFLLSFGRAQFVQIGANRIPREDLLAYCFGKDSDPSFQNKTYLAKLFDMTLSQVDDWYRQKRLGSTATLPSPNLSASLNSKHQSDGVSHGYIEEVPEVNSELTHDTNNPGPSPQSPVPTANLLGAADFVLPHPELDENSQTTLVAEESISNQGNERYKCTYPGCTRPPCNGVGDQIRHESEVHWRERYYPCIFCCATCVDGGGFKCRFCGEIFAEASAIEQHILSPCNLHKMVKISPHRLSHAEAHQLKRHSSTNEADSELKCSFCKKLFTQSDDPQHHECKRKEAWQKHQDVKSFFNAEGSSTIWGMQGARGWVVPTPGGYPNKWPTECSHPICTESFDSLYNRAKHYDTIHYMPTSTSLKRKSSESRRECAGEDQSSTSKRTSQRGGELHRCRSTGEPQRRCQPSHRPELSSAVRSMDLAGAGVDKLMSKPP